MGNKKMMSCVFLVMISFIMITELNGAEQTLLSLIWGNLCQMLKHEKCDFII